LKYSVSPFCMGYFWDRVLLYAWASSLFHNLLFFLVYSYVHTMFGSFLPPSPCSLPYPSNPSLPGRNYFALISSFHNLLNCVPPHSWDSRNAPQHPLLVEVGFH
jgi:hypothetical protein